MRSMTSPVSATSATSVDSLPGMPTAAHARDATKNAQTPTLASAAEARALHASLAHAHATQEQLLLSNKLAQMEFTMKLQQQVRQATTQHHHQLKKSGKNKNSDTMTPHAASADVIRETLLLRERMLAFGKGDPVWRPW